MNKKMKNKNLILISFPIFAFIFVFILMFSVGTKVYAYFTKSSSKLVTFNNTKDKNYINNNELMIYKVTLKNLYLFCLKEEYKQTQWDLLVLLANKTLKNYSSIDIAFLLNVPLEKYKRLESGCYLFNGELSYKNVAEKLEFSENEFYYDFCKAFIKVN